MTSNKNNKETTIPEAFNPMTEGNITYTLVKFAIPLAFTMFLQVLYGAADVFIVGLYADKTAISAIANGAQFMFIVMGFVMGLTVGGTVLIGVHVGEKNSEGVAQAIGTTAVLFGAISLILTPFLAGFTETFVSWMRVPSEAMEPCIHYIFICSLGIPFIIGYNVISAIYRGLGDSKTPLIFVGIACILNIIIDFILIGGFGMSVMGAALATTLSQGVSFLLAVLYIRKKGCGFQIRPRHFTLNREAASKIIRVGLPLAYQDCLVSISFMIIMIFVNTMGVVASASVGISGRIIGFCMIPPVSLAGAVATMTAQNMGAGKPRRTILSLRYGILFSLIFGIGTWTFFQFVPELATGIFTNDATVRQGAAQYLQSFTIDCVLVSVIFSMNSYFSGCGKSFVCMLYSLVSTFGIRVPAAYWISSLPACTLHHLGFAAPLATLFSIVIALLYFMYVQRELASLTLRPKSSVENKGAVTLAT